MWRESKVKSCRRRGGELGKRRLRWNIGMWKEGEA